MNTKNVNKLVIIPLVFILVLTLSITYALFTKEVNTNNRNITLSSVDKYIGIYGPNKDNIGLNKDYTFTIENRGTTDAAYQLYLEAEGNIDLSKITYTISGDATKTGTLSDAYLLRDNLNSEQIHTITIRLTSTDISSYTGSIKVSTINTLDKTPPSLIVYKETYLEANFSDWTFEGDAYANSDNVLVLGENGNDASVTSDYYDVDGGFWYAKMDGYSNNQTKHGTLMNSSYYDINKYPTTTLEGRTANGWSIGLSAANRWENDLIWHKDYDRKDNPYVLENLRYGPNAKYVKLKYFVETESKYSRPMTMIRNLKIYGESIANSFYDIKVDAKDSDSSVESIKYAPGNQTVEYFKNGGTPVSNNTARVTSNGTYTVYAENRDGYATVSTIEITKIQ